ncbi:MAG: hypothetical protein GPJ54_19415 [Candidatus Heimdallarchaeota archaeon]|nr:hypothetical protein [Candidatus Heimdallarchaeota archaeon]
MVDYITNLEKGQILLGNKRVVAHCNHYNVFLQQTLTDALDKEIVVEVQKRASKRLNLEMMNSYFETHSSENKTTMVENLFASQGLGRIDFTGVSEGKGKVLLKFSHYGIAHYSKWGSTTEGICYLPAGFILASIEFIYGKSKDISDVVESQCIATNPEEFEMCVFEVN